MRKMETFAARVKRLVLASRCRFNGHEYRRIGYSSAPYESCVRCGDKRRLANAPHQKKGRSSDA